MKPLYHIFFFLTFFQLSALIIAGIGVFPEGTTLYSDFDMAELEDYADDPISLIGFIFAPEGKILGVSVDSFTAGFIVIDIIVIIAGLGIASAIFTQSFVPAVLVLFGVVFYPMIVNSYSFFEKVFVQWDNTSIMVLGISLLVGILVMFITTIVEIPTQGGS